LRTAPPRSDDVPSVAARPSPHTVIAVPALRNPHVSQPPGQNPYGDQPEKQPGGQPPEQNPYAQGYPQQPPQQQQPPAPPFGYPAPGGQGQGPGPGPGQGGPQGYPGYPPGYAGQPQQGYPAAPYGYGYQQGPMGLPAGMPPFASWGARVGAQLLDGLMFGLIPAGLVIAGYVKFIVKVYDAQQKCDDQGISSANCPNPKIQSSSLSLIAIGGLLGLAVTLYLAYREGKTGQTPGKRIVGIRLLRLADGSALGFGMAFGRRLLHVLDSMACCLGYLWPLWDDKRQTFADKCVSTVVVKDQL
jgi:uncharacterized RDD family membrane protein YckC